MAQQPKLTYEGTFNHPSTGLFKANTTRDIGADDAQTLVTNTKDSVPFTLDDSYTWPFPQATASGTDTYTATLSPVITAYVVGQKFQILFTNANTGAATLNLNSVGALAITKNGTTSLSAGDIQAGSIKILTYDGTRLQIIGNIGGGGSVTSVSGTTNRITSTGGATPVIDIDAAYDAIVAAKAPIASPTFTGTPAAPTATTGTNTTQIATTAFVQQEIAASISLASMTYRTLTATHELDATDLASITAGDQLTIRMNAAGAIDLEIPTNAVQAFAIGTIIGLEQMGVGQLTILPDAGVTLRSPNSANKTFAQYSKAYIEKVGTNEWLLSGDITV